MFPQFISFINESSFFYENFSSKYNFPLFFSQNDFFLIANTLLNHNFPSISVKSDLYSSSLITFINQVEDINLYNNLDNAVAIYHYSIPNTKLAYPEPFIASPSFMHTDLWFIHILVYQYWLWFVFVFIIVFFFITFICTLRWCNMRIRPRRETRGLSRSKCGDLITACVPVTWATSIIVNESTDAIDYYDGFGTTELVVGVRAYQWGWEYYYPKDIDLNYNLKPNYSMFVGNSLKYNHASDVTLSANNLWKFYQNKNTDHVVTPAHLLVLPLDNYKLFNFLNFNDLGSNGTQEFNAFKRARMFSKIFTSNLVFSPDVFSNKYKNLNHLYINETLFTDSYLYGLKRQHNYLSTNSLLNNNSTFLDLNSVNKVINHNFKNAINTRVVPNQIFFFNLNKELINETFINSLPGLSTLLNNLAYSKDFAFFNTSSNYNNLFSILFNNETRIKDSFIIFDSVNEPNHVKTVATIFSNQPLTLTDKYIKNFSQTYSFLNNEKFVLNLNPFYSYLFVNNNNSSTGLTSFFFFNLENLNWTDLNTSNKLFGIKTPFNHPFSSTNSDHLLTRNSNMSNLPDELNEQMLQKKEELISNFLNNMYWNIFWPNANTELKLHNNQNYHDLHRLFYFPMFNFYYDYDFRNWQAIELLEDSFWESNYSIYNHDEYMSLADDFYEYEFFDKYIKHYNLFNRLIKYSGKILNKPIFKDTNSLGEYYAGSFYLDDAVSPSTLLLTKDFSIFPIFSIFNYIDESYESLKSINYLFNVNNKSFFLSSSFNFQPHSYAFVFDMFRSNYEGFSWFSDENNSLKLSSENFLKLFSASQKLVNWNNIILNNTSFLDSYWLNDLNLINYSSENDLYTNNTIRFSNNLNLRSSVKSSIVTYNALQKVFRARFDENRSNAKLIDFGYSYTKQPFISSSRIQYEKILGKTKENFLKINFYKNSFSPFLNNLYELNSSLNFYFYDFPFLLGLKSDASKHLWFDWFSKWGFYEVQPSSSSRYAIYGMPYFSKNFEFNTISAESLNESENYLIRIARARRNYLPNWTYTPYFYARNVSWYQNNIFYDIINSSDYSITSTQYILNLMNWYWNSLYFLDYHNNQFHSSNSGLNSYTKLGWKPQNSIQSYYYNVSNLIDILTKREFLYRELFSINNKIINLPFYLTNNPSNPLINDIKASFLFIDPIIYNNEYSRDIYFNSLNFFNFTILKSFLSSCNDFINLNLITDYLFYYFFDANLTNTLQHNSELYKNQYRPLRKGVTNMIRLHATGAIAMPVEIRLQILASSKDVIHSWAIPSAGIKIDCVPGYSSHKVIIFLVSGIFWGQCMEICGRYHHWMPIVVYFMKRDLFFLWCTHFVFLTGSNNMWTINDRQFADYIRLASFDKYSWLSELNN